jgi:hypothetical protein
MWWGLEGRGAWCGAVGRRQRKKGGPLNFHRPTSKSGSYAVRRKFRALLLGGVHRSRTRNTRGACDENERTKFGVSGENADWNVRVQILTPKLTGYSSHAVDKPYCMGMSSLHSHKKSRREEDLCAA